MNRKALIYYQDILAGYLYESDEGFIFTYDEKYLNSNYPPISLTLPKNKQSYLSNVLFPFFDGLIPEGWLLDLLVKKNKLHLEDRFELLLHLCNNPIGAVSIQENKE